MSILVSFKLIDGGYNHKQSTSTSSSKRCNSYFWSAYFQIQESLTARTLLHWSKKPRLCNLLDDSILAQIWKIFGQPNDIGLMPTSSWRKGTPKVAFETNRVTQTKCKITMYPKMYTWNVQVACNLYLFFNMRAYTSVLYMFAPEKGIRLTQQPCFDRWNIMYLFTIWSFNF